MKTQEQLVEKLKTAIHNQYTVNNVHSVIAQRITVRADSLIWALDAEYKRYLPTKDTCIVYAKHKRSWGMTVDLFVIKFDTENLTVSFVDIKDAPAEDVGFM